MTWCYTISTIAELGLAIIAFNTGHVEFGLGLVGGAIAMAKVTVSELIK